MGKSRKRKRRRGPLPQVTVELQSLELAAGHDGFLRGKPEPVVLLAVLWVTQQARLVGRAAVRFGAIGRYPCTISPVAPAAITGRAPAPGRLVVVAIALEEDATADVARVYALLENIHGLRFWPSAAEVPHPVPIEDLAVAAQLVPINVLSGTRDLSDLCIHDDYIGACAAGLAAEDLPRDLRLHFVSADRKNDWTALLHIQGTWS